MSINERIKCIAETLYNGNVNELCKAIGVKQATMSNIVAGRLSKPSFEVINAIISNTKVNSTWLITGKGEMLTTDETQSISNSIESHLDNDSKDYLGIIKSQQKTIENLSDTINKLITK